MNLQMRPLPYSLTASVTDECRLIDYKQVFLGYFHQEFVGDKEDVLQSQEEQIDKAFSCIQNVLKQITSEIRGEQTDSLSKEEMKTLLNEPSIQKLFTDMGLKNVGFLTNALQDSKKFDRFVEIKNFVIDVISYFSSDLSSKTVCGNKRDRFYKWEMEVLIAFLGTVRDWMKDVNGISETVWTEFIGNMFLKTSGAVNSYFGPFYSEGKYKIRKSLFETPAHSIDYFLPSLSKGFEVQAPDLSAYITESVSLHDSFFVSDLTWDYFSLQSHLDREKKERAEMFSQAISIIIENNRINKSGFLKKSDILFIVMNFHFMNALFNAYDANGDFRVTTEEFRNGTACLEDFLLPLFENKKEAFLYFVEFQKNPKKAKNWVSYYRDTLFGDEGFDLPREGVAKLSAVLFSTFFPYSLIEKDTKTEKEDLLLALKQIEKQSKESEAAASPPAADDSQIK